MTQTTGILAAAAMALALACTPGAALAQGAAAPQAEAAKPAATVSIDELMKPGAIRENALGDEKAPVTVIEYASLTCPHCASFHAKTYPALKKDYIETGKVRFIFRDFPFDGVAMAGTMISRCAEPAKFFPMTEALFSRQEKWAFGKDPETELLAIAKEFGFTQESFDTCLQNQTLYDGVLAVRQRAFDTFKVDSTPTLFVNGVAHRGALTPEQMEAAIKPFLTEKK